MCVSIRYNAVLGIRLVDGALRRGSAVFVSIRYNAVLGIRRLVIGDPIKVTVM